MTQAHTPTADTVRKLARSLLKGSGTGGPEAAAGLVVRPVCERSWPAAWWVGGQHVLRLAPDRETSARLRRELRLRDLVRPHVPVELPAAVAQGEWAQGLLCTLDTRLSGGPAEENTVSAIGEADLSALLTGLREVPVRQVQALGVPRVSPRPLGALRRTAQEAAERLAAADEFDSLRLDQLTQPATVQLAAQPGTAVLAHHALTGGHLMVGGGGRVRGVLGWDAAVLGDPAEDIACLAGAVGAPAAVRSATLAGYGARTCLRGLWLAGCDAVVHLAGGLRGTAGSLALLRTRLRRAWEPIMLERVTDLRDSDDML